MRQERRATTIFWSSVKKDSIAALLPAAPTRPIDPATSWRLTRSLWTGPAGLTPTGLLAQRAPPGIVRADSPCPPFGHRLTSLAGLIEDEPLAELPAVAVRVERRVGPICLVVFDISHRACTPPVIGLEGEREEPTRHRDGNTIGGELLHVPVEPFRGRLARDSLVAGRRRTSFSLSSSLFRRRCSACSLAVAPFFMPSSASAFFNYAYNVVKWIPKSFAIWDSSTPGSRFLATRTTSSRNFLGYGFNTVHILPAQPHMV
ncbi:hypothetical protein [Kocuria sp.]|uniref:hypothetical protein n=1 Tax=Kocuria sp. TaxID=1871328 RepID=UPI003F8D7CCD